MKLSGRQTSSVGHVCSASRGSGTFSLSRLSLSSSSAVARTAGSSSSTSISFEALFRLAAEAMRGSGRLRAVIFSMTKSPAPGKWTAWLTDRPNPRTNPLQKYCCNHRIDKLTSTPRPATDCNVLCVQLHNHRLWSMMLWSFQFWVIYSQISADSHGADDDRSEEVVWYAEEMVMLVFCRPKLCTPKSYDGVDVMWCLVKLQVARGSLRITLEQECQCLDLSPCKYLAASTRRLGRCCLQLGNRTELSPRVRKSCL